MAANSVARLCSWWMGALCGGKSNSFKPLWKSLLPTNEEDPFKNEGARVVTTDPPL